MMSSITNRTHTARAYPRAVTVVLAIMALALEVSSGQAQSVGERQFSFAPLHFEPQDWSTPKDAWLVNRHTDTKWNLWSTDRHPKGWTGGVVLQGPVVRKDRATPEEGAPPLHTRITGIPEGRYDVTIKAGRTIAVSLDGKTWRRYTHGPVAENVHVANGVFEVWVDDRYAHKKPGPCYYDRVTLTPCPPVEGGLRNPRFEYLDDGKPAGWRLIGHFHYDADAKFASLASAPPERQAGAKELSRTLLSQAVELRPGHYVLRTQARATTIEGALFARSLHYRGVGDRCGRLSGPFVIPTGMGADFHEVELPFFVEDQGGASRQVTLGIQSGSYKGCAHHKVDVRELSLTRLGDTELKYGWAQNLPMKPWHGLTTLRENAQWERPGRVIFADTYTGAELWLMTQGEKSYLRAQGVRSFSADGKYLYVKHPGVILRTDGSARWTGFSRSYPANEPWLAAWIQRRLPPGSDPSDWVLAKRPDKTAVPLRNLVTGETFDIRLPRKAGWTLLLLPGKQNGVRLETVTHETFAWLSDDGKRVGLSRPDGSHFRAFAVKSMSDDPAKDVLHWPHKLTWFQDFKGRWYVAYALNWIPWFFTYPQTPANTINPGQIWVLPVDEDDTRGVMRVVSGTESPPMHMLPYELEDGTVLHWWTATHRAMNAEAGYRIRGAGCSTLALESPTTGRVEHFIGNYPCLDHIDFSHPSFIFPESLLYPYTLLCIDVKRRAMWPITSLQFRDYGPYTAGGGAGLFAQNPSPDVTKIACVSSMLCRADITADGSPWEGNRVIRGKRPKTALDVYNVVVRYPQPPVNVRLENDRVRWDKPEYHREIKGFNLYRADESGIGFAKMNARLITGLSHPLPEGKRAGFWALTSAEHSGLESRMFSEELAVDRHGAPFRHFYEAETTALAQPMAPVFDTPGASNAYGVAVQDRDLLFKARLDKGLKGTGTLRVRVPVAGPCRVLARSRALKPGRKGEILFRINGNAMGSVAVGSTEWRWIVVSRGPVTLQAGQAELTFASRAVGIALDNICITNDLTFTPVGKSNTPHLPPAAPRDVRRVIPTADDVLRGPKTQPGRPTFVKLAWTASAAPQGVRYYNVYRAPQQAFEVGPECLICSPNGTAFIDCGLAPRTYYYRVAAVDAWANESAPSRPFKHEAKLLGVIPRIGLTAPEIGGGDEAAFDGSATTVTRGKVTSWRWDFGDGTKGVGRRVRHAYAGRGDFMARLTVETDAGERASVERRVHILPSWLRKLDTAGTVLVEAEELAAEGGGVSQVRAGRPNTSGAMRTYWHKHKGHWLEWRVSVPKPGKYKLVFKYCTGSARAIRNLRIDEQFPNGACKKLVFPSTGGFSTDEDNWSYLTVEDDAGAALPVTLMPGSHKMRMSNLEGGLGLDYFLLVRVE